MSLHIKKKPRELIPADSYAARCWGVVDLGTQYSEAFGKAQPKVAIFWEFPELRIKINRDGEDLDMPKVKSAKYTMSNDKKSSLRKMLTTWRGRDFTADEMADFDIQTIVDAPCLVQIVHTKSEHNGETYDNIASVSKLPRGMTIGLRETPKLVFSLPDELPCQFPENMPPWVQEIIMASEEWKKAVGARGPSNSTSAVDTDPGYTDDGEPAF